MGRLRSMPVQRYESSGSLDAGSSNMVNAITYQAAGTTDDFDSVLSATTGNIETMVTNKPVIIYQYEATCIWGGAAGVMFQFYGDDDDSAQLNSWDMSNSSFVDGCRNKVFMGAQPSFESSDSPPYGHAPQFKVYKLKFKAKKNPRKMRAKFGKWAIPPIVISSHKKNYFGFTVTNLKTGTGATSFDDQRYYAHVELKRWQTEF